MLRKLWLVTLLTIVLPVWANNFLDNSNQNTSNNYLPPTKTFLLPEQAFKIQVNRTDNDTFLLTFTPAPGYYIYRDKIHIVDNHQQPLGTLELPQATQKEDPVYGHVWVYFQPFTAKLTIHNATTSELGIAYQGCALHGICYPPTVRHFTMAAAPNILVPLDSPNQFHPSELNSDSTNPNDFAAFLGSASFTWMLLSFFAFGLLLSLTPCVFPMVPILSGIIAGQGSDITKLRAFWLSITYVLGMSVTYAIAGVIAGLTGTLVSNSLQTPPVEIAIAIIFILLALSMFDVYQLQIPASWQTKLNHQSNRLPGGKYLAVAIMGLISALVVGPCVAAPLAGGLIYIAQTKNWLIGGSALFVMSLGMGAPLVLIGTSAGAFLPRAGQWMNWVKRFFGVLLIAVAVWMVKPLWIGLFKTEGPHFQAIHSVAELDKALNQARVAHKPVFLDFYADWCTSCIEMENSVFSEKEVKNKLETATLLRADVTKNSTEDRAILARFGLFGPPGMILYNKNGVELINLRMAGFVPKDQFMRTLEDAFR
ncbi:protein-disulfide reductase DsbD [Ferrovum sp. PN-J185]|uniref:protein-disulfide reductase DsbD n=1 Tax=Ferrovum sp. PN-J185 TaxID=1356306 RepID=UPI0007922C40|nr:protein-disulfide reductase DsbD [Ferrovum sp. PN-J185]KXW55747.1 thiol:disulfide interchange protein DsbD precursor [Ferrovum sp. PN-J185]MCC6068555.1 protein-disulfide reductase DsbD [Ferrovum sp. PN-J185]MDE1892132.1 protein-disulfide reductase DsbD [Betaproteobacteria bacterium]